MRKNRAERKRLTSPMVFIGLALLGIIILMYLNYNSTIRSSSEPNSTTIAPATNLTAVESQLLPAKGYMLSAKWGAAPRTLVESGALNVSSLSAILGQAGQQLTPDELNILNGTSTENITINSTNARFVLYLLWAIGINNNDTIINKGPLMHFGGDPNQLASTGGYAPLGKLSLGQLSLVSLTPAQQSISDYVASNTYRPCCNNPTMFPDCNHGAAALGLIELMASQGSNQSAIFKSVEDFNVMEFPGQYITIAKYLKMKGSSWNATPASTVLSSNFSSALGFSQVQAYVSAHQNGGQPAGGGSRCGA